MSLRSEYFKTALNTEVGGGQKRLIAVEECSYIVLSAIIDFMYGINLPDDFSMEDMYSLLAMADLYLMEGLKDAVAPLFGKHLKTDNVQDTSRLAEKHGALKLKDVCCDFILANIDQLLGVNLAELDHFKKRNDFSSDEHYIPDEVYSQYVKANIKPNMLVRCTKITLWADSDDYSKQYDDLDHTDVTIRPVHVQDGTLGQVVSIDGLTVTVKWQGTSKCVGAMNWVEILTPPCDIFA